MLRFLVNKVEGNNATSSLPANDLATMTPPNASKPKTVKMWACDICKNTFLDFDEACRCEDKCRRKLETTIEETANETFTAQVQQSSAQIWSCDVCQEQFTEYDVACRHEDACRDEEHRKEARLAMAPLNEASKPVHPFFAKEQATKQKSKKRTKQQQKPAKQPVTSMNGSPDESFAETKRKKRKATTKKKQTELTKKARSTSTAKGAADKQVPKEQGTKPQGTNKKRSGKPQAAIADIFANKGGVSQIMAEHKAAEFAAKRRKDAERERERQMRRQENKQQINASKSTTKSSIKKTPSIPPEARFPVPSHVTTAAPDSELLPNSSVSWISQDYLSEAQGRLEKTLRYQAGSVRSLEVVQGCTALLPTKPNITTALDPLQSALVDLLVPPEKVSDSMETWCNKYAIRNVPEDVCGEQNKERARELLKFVDEWKVERQRAHERRAKKQRALLKSKKEKWRTKYVEDDLWGDSDNEDGGLCSVCLLTGPSGSGKTNLVHAVAQQSGCKVLEINTTERRGGQALKRAIEEATQSDSSLDMLKKTQMASDTNPLVDSDDEMEETKHEGSSIIVILIDEVDIMFEDAGDSGFWSAMSTLTKKAKCPIFLTANFVPDPLLSSTIRYLHLETVSPKPEECVSKIRRIVKSEGLNRTENFANCSAAKKQLSCIAQLCKCDLRRVINELQIFATSSPRLMNNVNSSMECDSSETKLDSGADPVVPIISDISPKEVSPHGLSLLTIKGKQFNVSSTGGCPETSLDVFVGNQVCPAVQVLDDSTILVVCPPCSLTLGVMDSGVIGRTGRESRTSRFAPVSIQMIVRGRVFSRSDANATTTSELCDETSSTSLSRKWNVEYAFPPPRYGMLADNDEVSVGSESGCEEGAGNKISEAAAANARSQRSFTKEEAAVILEEGAREWNVRNPQSKSKEDSESSCPPVTVPGGDPAQELSALSYLSELSSDAAFFEDAFEFGGVPFLAGVVPGFGSSLVSDTSAQSNSEGNERKLLRDANARPPSFERLFSLGWNDEGCFFGNCDAYMVYPTSICERRLLARSQSLERGLSCAVSAGTVSSDSYHDDDHNDPGALESLAETIKLQESPRHVSEEDLFIRPHHSSSLLSLSNDLRRHVIEAGLGMVGHCALVCLPNVLENKTFRRTGLLSDILKEDADPSKSRLLCEIARLNETTIVPFQNRMEGSLFLDYLPMLCNMALHERAAEHAFQQVRDADPETATAMTGRRRTTRRSGQSLEREHYFVSVRSCRENSVANEIGSELAEEVLHYTTIQVPKIT